MLANPGSGGGEPRHGHIDTVSTKIRDMESCERVY